MYGSSVITNTVKRKVDVFCVAAHGLHKHLDADLLVAACSMPTSEPFPMSAFGFVSILTEPSRTRKLIFTISVEVGNEDFTTSGIHNVKIDR